MPRYLLGALVATLAVTLVVPTKIFSAQSAAATAGSGQSAAQSKAAEKAVTLNGCLRQDAGTPGQFTFAESSTGDKYHLIGRGIGKFAGHQVEIVGGPDRRRVTVRGGLLPSTNVAAQAGALDPARAAIANQPGGGSTGTGGVPLPELHVSRVRLLNGVCE